MLKRKFTLRVPYGNVIFLATVIFLGGLALGYMNEGGALIYLPPFLDPYPTIIYVSLFVMTSLLMLAGFTKFFRNQRDWKAYAAITAGFFLYAMFAGNAWWAANDNHMNRKAMFASIVPDNIGAGLLREEGIDESFRARYSQIYAQEVFRTRGELTPYVREDGSVALFQPGRKDITRREKTLRASNAFNLYYLGWRNTFYAALICLSLTCVAGLFFSPKQSEQLR